MFSANEKQDLIEQARQSEERQRRLDQVEDFLLSQVSLGQLLMLICPFLASLYGLNAVSLVLWDDDPLWRQLLPDQNWPEDVRLTSKENMTTLLEDLQHPYLVNKIEPELGAFLFNAKAMLVRSLAVLPLKINDKQLGLIAFGSSSAQRYDPSLETHFLERLSAKLARGLYTSCLTEQNRRWQQQETVLEMAGAACYELASPLSALEDLLGRLGSLLPSTDAEILSLLKGIRSQTEELSQLVLRLSQVEDVSLPFVEGLKITDENQLEGVKKHHE